MHPNPPEACLNPRLLGPAPVSDSVDLTWSLRTCISGRFTGDAAASVGTTLGWGPIILGDLSHRRMIIWPGEELEPFLAPEVDQVWAGLCSVGFIHCASYSSSEVPQKGGTTSGRVQEAFGMLLVFTVFGTINGSRCEGGGLVLAMRRGPSFPKSTSTPSRNIDTLNLTLKEHVLNLLLSTYT